MKEKNSLIEGSIWKGLLAFVFPIFLGQVFQQLYNTADAWVVGKFLEPGFVCFTIRHGFHPPSRL